MTSPFSSNTTLLDFITPDSRASKRQRSSIKSPGNQSPPSKNLKVTMGKPKMVKWSPPAKVNLGNEGRFLTVSDHERFVELVTTKLDFGLTEWNDRSMALLEYLLENGFINDHLQAQDEAGNQYDLVHETSNLVMKTFADRQAQSNKEVDGLAKGLRDLQLQSMRSAFEQEELIQMIGNFNLGAASSNKGYKLQEEIRTKMLTKLSDHPEASRKPDTMKDISSNLYLQMTGLITNAEIVAMGLVKESNGVFTVLTQFKLRSRTEIDLLRKIAQFLNCTCRSSVPRSYREQRAHLMEKVKAQVPLNHWVRVDARLGRDTVDWAVMVKPPGPASRWERWSLASVVYDADDYLDAMRAAADQIRGRLGTSGRS